MYETNVTVVGTLVTGVSTTTFGGGSVKASFRVACNERRFDKASDTWTNGDSLYLPVVCWRDLAERVQASLSMGDPVMVRGRLFTREYDDKDGRRNSVVELEASAVGPNLRWSTASVTRVRRGAEGTSAPMAGVSSDAPVAQRESPDVAEPARGETTPDGATEPESAWRAGPLVGPRAG